jgi:quercetin dioxygenase-like cupin family protein
MNEKLALFPLLIVAVVGCAPAPLPPPPPPPPPPGAVPPAAAEASTPVPAGSSTPVIRFNAQDITWTDAPPWLPAGAKIAVLEGDPKKPGLFTMRLRLPANARLNPHTHPNDERATLLSGTIHVGFGEKFDPSKGKTFTAGAFYITPTPTPHFVWTDEPCEVQVTAMGPWGLHYVDPADQAKMKP